MALGERGTLGELGLVFSPSTAQLGVTERMTPPLWSPTYTVDHDTCLSWTVSGLCELVFKGAEVLPWLPSHTKRPAKLPALTAGGRAQARGCPRAPCAPPHSHLLSRPGSARTLRTERGTRVLSPPPHHHVL